MAEKLKKKLGENLDSSFVAYLELKGAECNYSVVRKTNIAKR